MRTNTHVGTMQVVLVRPPLITGGKVIAARSLTMIPPLGLVALAAWLRSHDIDVSIVDAFGEAPDTRTHLTGYDAVGLTTGEILERIPCEARIVGVSCMFSNDWPYVRDLMSRIRAIRPDLVLVLGGEHATALPEYCLSDCPAIDYLINGEGELSFLALCSALAKGELPGLIPGVWSRSSDGVVPGQPVERLKDLDGMPLPAWDLVPLETYLSRGFSIFPRAGRRIMPIVSSRGCRYSCKFCSNKGMFGSKHLRRSPEKVVEEILLYKTEHAIDAFEFAEPSFAGSREWLVRFCKCLLERGVELPWTIPGIRSEPLDEEVVSLLRESGCTYVYLTPDSGSPSQIREMDKKVDLDRVFRVARAFVERGIGVRVHLVIGFPNEGHFEILRTIRYGARLAWLGIPCVLFLRFTPYPGSDYFKLCAERGQIPCEGQLFDRFLVGNVTGDLLSVKSFSTAVSSPSLLAYVLGGMVATQASFAIRHPLQALASVRRVATHRPDQPLEYALVDILDRFVLGRH